MPTQTVHVILNPKSDGGRAVRLRGEIERELRARGVDVVMHETLAPGHGRELAFELARAGAHIVAAAGGDGTIHDVANGLLQSGTTAALAIIPAGTGNDFAKVVPGAGSRRDAYDTIARPALRAYDVGHAQWHTGSEFFVNGMGTGIDVEVTRQIVRLPPMPGAVKYTLGLMRALLVYRPATLRARLAAETLERRVMMFAVGNGVCQGGGFFLTPHARPADGVLELCAIEYVPIWMAATMVPRILRGTHTGHPSVTMRGFQRLRFEQVSDGTLFFQLDGELREPADARWLDIEVRPGALAVVVRG